MNQHDFDREGFIETAKDWDENMAKGIAMREGIGSLEENHWRVINYLRYHYLKNKGLPVMKHVCHELNLDEGCVSELFGDPEKAWKISGLPDYGEEFKSYIQTAEQHH